MIYQVVFFPPHINIILKTECIVQTECELTLMPLEVKILALPHFHHDSADIWQIMLRACSPLLPNRKLPFTHCSHLAVIMSDSAVTIVQLISPCWISNCSGLKTWRTGRQTMWSYCGRRWSANVTSYAAPSRQRSSPPISASAKSLTNRMRMRSSTPCCWSPKQTAQVGIGMCFFILAR